MRDLLQRAGFKIRGSRADCIHCTGSSRGTVSFTAEVAFCHRCKWTANAAQLAHKQGRSVPTEDPRHRRARERVEEFYRWLWRRCGQLSDKERRLSHSAELAKQVLAKYPDCEPAWDALARWYHAERTLQDFWDLAQCNDGRKRLFMKWLKKTCLTPNL